MSSAAKIRAAAFALGVTGLFLSLSTLAGAFLRPIDTSDYIKQGEEGVPWVQVGLLSSAIGLIFSFFGRRWWRIAAVGLSFLLIIQWFLIGESLF